MLSNDLCQAFSASKKLLEVINFDENKLILHNARFTPLKDLEKLYPNEVEFQSRNNILHTNYLDFVNSLDKILYYDQRTYLSSLLNRLDKMSMAASLEGRVPFLDYRIIEWSYSIPDSIKIKFF